MQIPERVYRLVERKLRQAGHLQDRALEQLREAKARAYFPSASMPEGSENQGADGLPDASSIRAQGKHDGQERKTLAVLTAEEELAKAEQWEQAIQDTDGVYPRSSPEGMVAMLYYRLGWTQAAICSRLHIDRQTARRRRDTYVINCALFAAAAGLIELKETDHD